VGDVAFQKEPSQMIIIYTTMSNNEQAESIAQVLITEHLVACVNMWPVNSIYTWDEKIEKTIEVAMFLKTSDICQKAVYQRLLELHPYDCPAIITLDVTQTHPAFAQWVETQTVT
jgi:periplasmic divalent cation tolerance protein